MNLIEMISFLFKFRSNLAQEEQFIITIVSMISQLEFLHDLVPCQYILTEILDIWSVITLIVFFGM